MEKQYNAVLTAINEKIQKGPFQDTWNSLSRFKAPEWLRDSKFGIFIHWGIYSVIESGSEWYARNAYLLGSEMYNQHVSVYGAHKKFGYKDLIPAFTAEHFDAEQWVSLFKDSGAKFIMPVAEHHDGFQMYNSSLSPYTCVHMGPKRDVLGELKAACEQEELVFAASSHRAEHWWFMNGGRTFDSDVDFPMYAPAVYEEGMTEDDYIHNIHANAPNEAFLEDWLVRCCELVDRYQPKMVYFDWWIHHLAFKPYLRKFLAYYYNRGAEWGIPTSVTYKFDALAYHCGVLDIERGRLSSIHPDIWQSDTSIYKNSWGYTRHLERKTPNELICHLIDVISKNGVMLLNVGPRPDGIIEKEDVDILRTIGRWMEKNGEAIYGSTYWKVFGEGPTQIPEGHFTDTICTSYSSEDIRFTYKDGYIYAFALAYSDNHVRIRHLNGKNANFNTEIISVEILGETERPIWHMTEDGLDIYTKGLFPSLPLCFKITCI